MNGGTENFLLEKSEAVALRIVKLYQFLVEKGERVMSKQILRSGTSIGANITEGHSYFILHTFLFALVIGLFCGRWTLMGTVV